jgi:transcriptional regulator with XRE-family HTH domain
VISGQLVREARRRAGLSQTELGRRLGTSQAAIARWEQGKTAPSFETLRRAARACGLDLGVSLANADDSYDRHISDQLRLSPAQRVEWLANMLEVQQMLHRARHLDRRG